MSNRQLLLMSRIALVTTGTPSTLIGGARTGRHCVSMFAVCPGACWGHVVASERRGGGMLFRRIAALLTRCIFGSRALSKHATIFTVAFYRESHAAISWSVAGRRVCLGI